MSTFKSCESILMSGDYKAPWDNGTGATTGLGKTVAGAQGLRLPKLWKRKWNHSRAEQEAPSHSHTVWCLIVFLSSRGKVHTSCLPPLESLDLIKVKGTENVRAGQGASHRHWREACWPPRAPQQETLPFILAGCLWIAKYTQCSCVT